MLNYSVAELIYFFYPTFGRKTVRFCPNLCFLSHIWAKILGFLRKCYQLDEGQAGGQSQRAPQPYHPQDISASVLSQRVPGVSGGAWLRLSIANWLPNSCLPTCCGGLLALELSRVPRPQQAILTCTTRNGLFQCRAMSLHFCLFSPSFGPGVICFWRRKRAKWPQILVKFMLTKIECIYIIIIYIYII